MIEEWPTTLDVEWHQQQRSASALCEVAQPLRGRRPSHSDVPGGQEGRERRTLPRAPVLQAASPAFPQSPPSTETPMAPSPSPWGCLSHRSFGGWVGPSSVRCVLAPACPPPRVCVTHSCSLHRLPTRTESHGWWPHCALSCLSPVRPAAHGRHSADCSSAPSTALRVNLAHTRRRAS